MRFEDLDRAQRACRDRRGQSIGEELRARALHERVDERGAPCHEASGRAAERLTKRAG